MADSFVRCMRMDSGQGSHIAYTRKELGHIAPNTKWSNATNDGGKNKIIVAQLSWVIFIYARYVNGRSQSLQKRDIAWVKGRWVSTNTTWEGPHFRKVEPPKPVEPEPKRGARRVRKK